MNLLRAAALTLSILVLPAAAAAAPTWLPPETVSAPGDENAPSDLAVAPDGTAIVVWQRAECKNNGDPHECKNGRVQYSVRPPGGSFSAPVDMAGDPFASNMANPQVAVDGAGNAIAAWISGSGETARVRYAFRPAGGDFGGAKVVSDAGGGFHSFPSLDMVPSGRAVVTFFRLSGGLNRASYAVRAPGGDFGETTDFAGDTGTTVNQAPEVSLDASGGGVANWARFTPEGVLIHYATIAPNSPEFDAPETIEKGFGKLAIAPSGAAVMIWNLSGSADDLRYSFRPPGGKFGPPATLVEPDSPLGPQVAIAADGSVVAAWASLFAPDSFVRWAVAPPGGPFGPPIPLAPDAEGVVGDLAVSPQGTTMLLWWSNGEGREMRAALRSPGDAFGASTPLPGPPQGAGYFGASAAFDADGNAAAVWQGFDPGDSNPHDVPLVGAWLENRADPAPASASTTGLAPRIWRLRVLPRRFSARRGPPGRAQSSRRRGAKIRFRLSDRAAVRFAVQRPRPGVRVRLGAKSRCLPRTMRNLRRGKRRCVRYQRVRRFTRRNRRAGLNVLRFSGRFRGKALRSGRYRLVAVAVDDAGRRSKPARTAFRIR